MHGSRLCLFHCLSCYFYLTWYGISRKVSEISYGPQPSSLYCRVGMANPKPGADSVIVNFHNFPTINSINLLLFWNYWRPRNRNTFQLKRLERREVGCQTVLWYYTFSRFHFGMRGVLSSTGLIHHHIFGTNERWICDANMRYKNWNKKTLTDNYILLLYFYSAWGPVFKFSELFLLWFSHMLHTVYKSRINTKIKYY